MVVLDLVSLTPVTEAFLSQPGFGTDDSSNMMSSVLNVKSIFVNSPSLMSINWPFSTMILCATCVQTNATVSNDVTDKNDNPNFDSEDNDF